MFHWMLVAPQALKSVLPVEDSFTDKEMRTFSLSAHISLQIKHLTQAYEGEKQSQLLSTTSPSWFWRRMRLVVQFRDKLLSFPCRWTSCFIKDFSSQRRKEPVSYFNQYYRIFPAYWLARRPRDRYHCLQC